MKASWVSLIVSAVLHVSALGVFGFIARSTPTVSALNAIDTSVELAPAQSSTIQTFNSHERIRHESRHELRQDAHREHRHEGIVVHHDAEAEAAAMLAPSQAEAAGNADVTDASAHGVGHASPSELSRYVSLLEQALNRAKIYPRAAQMRGQEGRVVVVLSLAPTGELLDARISESSAFESLNQAALATVKGVGRYPQPPAGVGPNTWISVPIGFHLRQD